MAGAVVTSTGSSSLVMTLDIDPTVPIRRPADQRALVQAVIGAQPENETHWLEWKRTLRLDSAEGRFAIARQILGFANRHPDRAARFTGGYAYVVFGAEPGTAPGVDCIDVADLDPGLRRYLGDDGPLWSADYITTDSGTSVLLITVDPPRWGDRIFTLRRRTRPKARARTTRTKGPSSCAARPVRSGPVQLTSGCLKTACSGVPRCGRPSSPCGGKVSRPGWLRSD